MGTVSNVSYGSVHVDGTIGSLGGNIGWSFQYSTDEVTWKDGATGGGAGAVEADITGLKGSTHYFVRLFADNGAGEDDVSPGPYDPRPYPDFTTLPVDPPATVSISDASAVFSTTAKASGVVKRPVNPDVAFDVDCKFEYVTDAQFTSNPPEEKFAGATPVACKPEGNPAEDPIHAAGETNVNATLGGLAPLTTYHLRLSATNAGGTDFKVAASTFTTLAAVTVKPTVIAANDATGVSYQTAKVSGEVQRPVGSDPAFDVFCRFEYVTDAAFGASGFDTAAQVPCTETPAEAPISGTDPTPVSAELTGLKVSTTYHARLTASNGAGSTSKDASGTFKTLDALPPSFDVDPILAGAVDYTTAHVTGTVDSGTPARTFSWGWQYTTDPDKGWEGGICCGSEPGSNEYSTDFGSLKPGTKYYVRMVAYDYTEDPAFWIEPAGPYESFTTKGTSAPPAASLGPVTGITPNAAHFAGTVDPKAPAEPLSANGKATYQTKWHFECTPECNDINGNQIGGIIEAEAGPQPVGGDVLRLDPNTEYKVKLIAENFLGTAEALQEFDTPLIKPTVKSAPGGSDGNGGYILQGSVNPNHSPVSDCTFAYGPTSGEDPEDYAFQAPCSPSPGGGAKAVTVEAPLTGLTPDAVYHFRLFATNGAGTVKTEDQEFIPTLDKAEPCANEQQRKENSSLALPECRGYEMVSSPGKEGFGVALREWSDGERLLYSSGAPNIAKSGQNSIRNYYVVQRTATGWETIPNLNGSSGSIYDAPTYANPDGGNAPAIYSSDLLSSIWMINKKDKPDNAHRFHRYLRSPDGTFTLIGSATSAANVNFEASAAASDDLSHFITWGVADYGNEWGPGVYEYVGTGMAQPRRVDLDNSGAPVSSCIGRVPAPGAPATNSNAYGLTVSDDGGTILFMAYGALGAAPGTCGAGAPPADEIWARVNGTTSIDVSASHCDRVAPAPVCNAPADANFAGATPDGSRVFFTTTQQLVNADTDQTYDLYACDLPSGNPVPAPGKANSCAVLKQISGAQTGAKVEVVEDEYGGRSFPGATFSDDGSTALFVAKGVLADNKDALGEKAVAGDHNLYVWHADASHPDGQTVFVGRLNTNDLSNTGSPPQAAADGRYVVFTTGSQLAETDTDEARDIYRVDAGTGELTRVSTNVSGVGGNGPSDAVTPASSDLGDSSSSARSGAISDDGQKIVFTTAEALSPADGNAETDAYLWTPTRVSLITSGSVEGGASEATDPFSGGGSLVAIEGSGRDIYFQTPAALSPADDDSVVDVYDARIGGGFSFAEKPICTGEGCQPGATPAPPSKAPLSAQPGPGNPPPPKTCPKGKVLKKNGKCVKKPGKKHHSKKHKRASSNGGGGK
jgi:hypothetical protein